MPIVLTKFSAKYILICRMNINNKIKIKGGIMYEQICFFISTHFFVQFIVFILGLFFGMTSLFYLLFAIAGILSYATDKGREKEDWQLIGVFIAVFILAGLIASPFIVTFTGLQKYHDVQQIKGNWLITKNKIVYLKNPKVIKTSRLPAGFYRTLLGTQIKIEPLPVITLRLPIIDHFIDHYNSLYVLSNGKIIKIKSKKLQTKKIQVDSWAKDMPTEWKAKHYTFWMWEWSDNQIWRQGYPVKYTP